MESHQSHSQQPPLGFAKLAFIVAVVALAAFAISRPTASSARASTAVAATPGFVAASGHDAERLAEGVNWSRVAISPASTGQSVAAY